MKIDRLYEQVDEVKDPEQVMRDYLWNSDDAAYMAPQPNHQHYVGSDEDGVWIIEEVEHLDGSKEYSIFRRNGSGFEEKDIGWEEAQDLLAD